MEPLLGPENPLGYPAPYPFLIFFKVFGFSLHMIPMHLWYAGMISLLILRWRGGEQARILSLRVLNAMPVIVALGINLGIVPLLFTQVAYYQAFYPATILMAWPWFSVIGLLLVAYYGLYLYVIGLRRESLKPYKRAAGWLSAGIFLVIGFLFANAFSLMANPEGWKPLWLGLQDSGAPLGLGLNTADPTFFPRWLMMFGMALMTTGAYVAVDAHFFAAGESPQYRAWARRTAWPLHTLGLVTFALMGTVYFFVTLQPGVRTMMLEWPGILLTGLTALSPGIPWLLLFLGRRGLSSLQVFLLALSQYGVLAFNAVSRQIVQNAELAPLFDPAAGMVRTQWSPMILFLVLFLLGLGVIGWMLLQIRGAGRPPVASG